jgi:hypothetical protein
VKLTLFTLLVLSMCCPLCVSQNSRSTPAPIRHAQELQSQLQFLDNAPPPANPEALRQEADQLASLAASVPPDIKNANKGILSKDLIQKLKQIEKLSKRLRNELSH